MKILVCRKLGNFNNFIKQKIFIKWCYIYSERKIKFIFSNYNFLYVIIKKQLFWRINRFLRIETKIVGVKITKQAGFGKKAIYRSTSLYMTWIDDLVSSILWSKLDEMPSFKGLHVMYNRFIDYWNTKYEINIEMIFRIPEKTQTLQRILP